MKLLFSFRFVFNIQTRRPLTVSTLAHYFGLQCDEYLRLSLNSSSKCQDQLSDFTRLLYGKHYRQGQGKDAQCVILCMLYRQNEMLTNELDFIYNRQRINVSITRAQQLCILLTSQLLFNQPPLELFVNENTRNAFNLLTNFVNKSTKQSLDSHGNIK